MSWFEKVMATGLAGVVSCQAIVFGAQGTPPSKQELDKVQAALPDKPTAKPLKPRSLAGRYEFPGRPPCFCAEMTHVMTWMPLFGCPRAAPSSCPSASISNQTWTCRDHS